MHSITWTDARSAVQLKSQGMTLLTAIETDLNSRRLFVAALISHKERLADLCAHLDNRKMTVSPNTWDSIFGARVDCRTIQNGPNT